MKRIIADISVQRIVPQQTTKEQAIKIKQQLAAKVFEALDASLEPHIQYFISTPEKIPGAESIPNLAMGMARLNLEIIIHDIKE